MEFTIDDPEVERLATELAAVRGVAPAEAIRDALRHELAAAKRVGKAKAWLEDFHRRHPPSGQTPLPKAFYDDLNDE